MAVAFASRGRFLGHRPMQVMGTHSALGWAIWVE
jgi:hypothetical protein